MHLLTTTLTAYNKTDILCACTALHNYLNLFLHSTIVTLKTFFVDLLLECALIMNIEFSFRSLFSICFHMWIYFRSLLSPAEKFVGAFWTPSRSFFIFWNGVRLFPPSLMTRHSLIGSYTMWRSETFKSYRVAFLFWSWLLLGRHTLS